MVNSDKCKTKGKQKCARKKCEQKSQKNKKPVGESTSVSTKPIKRGGYALLLPLPQSPKKSECVAALPLLKVKYFCCLSAFKRNSDGLESSNRPGPDSLGSLETFSPAPASPTLPPPAPPPSLWASLLSFCWVSVVSGSRN